MYFIVGIMFILSQFILMVSQIGVTVEEATIEWTSPFIYLLLMLFIFMCGYFGNNKK